MEYEIELKLLIPEDADEIIEKELLVNLDAHISKSIQPLVNHYFDTPSRTLRQHDMGLRIRGNGSVFEQTLKTAGNSIGGLQQRPEYNVQLNQEEGHSLILPTLSFFPSKAWPEQLLVSSLQSEITTLFSTDFERKAFLIETDEYTVELVLDKGVISAGDKQSPICELELELKRGEIKALFLLAKQIVERIPATIGIDSKAARGYQLLNSRSLEECRNTLLEKLAADELLCTENTQQHMDVDVVRRVEKTLTLFQSLSAAIRQQFNALLADKLSLVFQSLNEDIGWLKRQNVFEVPLSSIDVLPRLSKDWTRAVERSKIDECERLLIRAETTQWQLDLTQFLIQQGK